jgi:hypoxanthine-DNA glycosylase
MPPRLRSFKPFCDRRARALVLGTMPGPEALRRGEYYGFPGNHFWKILPAIFGEPPPADYAAKLRLLKKNRVAVWDVIESCERVGAADSAIRCMRPNRVPNLLERYPNVRMIFLNGKTAERLFRAHLAARISLPVRTLPSTSPAHASMSIHEKTKRWRALASFIRRKSRAGSAK